MSPKGTIDARHLWKRFRADRRRMLLRDELEHLRNAMRGHSSSRWRWALQDISLEVRPGESVGLIGINGSGKSTLLKVLARVMYPYAGSLDVTGRVGALIEVRAGIHPDLTGRENVYLYGSLLGLPRRQVTRRFDAIVEFAELESAIDRQVKFYSSGMQMRLGFAVAAFLEPDILLVDEVLAVGDSSFQQKCMQRMGEVLGQGATLVFVSHDLAAVEAAVERGFWLHNGVVAADGPVREVLGQYREAIEESAESGTTPTGPVRVLKAVASGESGAMPRTQGPFDVHLVLESDAARSASICVGVSDGPATPFFLVRRELELAAGETEARLAIPSLPLPRGRFYVWVSILDVTGRDVLTWHPTTHFDVAGPDLDATPRAVMRVSPIHVDASLEVEHR
ncbi:MAG TPA: ABC transporter ATP-binding protein [Actinomycetota bacterium]|jgi:ABC-type polysaccharide/polyol phosphate transport system ATPase subunit|nr:ABC transporter ATP-binding protein [Actinomycetota bacterium]